jgi:hypothetical protein
MGGSDLDGIVLDGDHPGVDQVDIVSSGADSVLSDII